MGPSQRSRRPLRRGLNEVLESQEARAIVMSEQPHVLCTADDDAGACIFEDLLQVGGRIGRIARGVDQCGHVRSAPGDQDGDALAAHSDRDPLNVTGSPVRSVSLPTIVAVSPAWVR